MESSRIGKNRAVGADDVEAKASSHREATSNAPSNAQNDVLEKLLPAQLAIENSSVFDKFTDESGQGA